MRKKERRRKGEREGMTKDKYREEAEEVRKRNKENREAKKGRNREIRSKAVIIHSFLIIPSSFDHS